GAVDEALRVAGDTGQACWLPELNRIKGDLILIDSPDDINEAKKYFLTALEIARRQKAKSWELRTSVSLGKLMRHADKTSQARELLSDICDWFSNKTETEDLKDAKALLQ
ncbi:MAG: hypothetical protein GTO41_09200, partial [Burkholderiales bacterium]|nr:hypothetical protein [Burkholderiales bacterium]